MSSACKKPTLAYVLGTTDCGSTLLAFVLDNHPAICALGEPPKRSIRRRRAEFRCSCGQSVDSCVFWMTLFGSLSQDECRFSTANWPNDYHYLEDLPNVILAKYQHSTLRRVAQTLIGGALPSHRRKTREATRCSIAFVNRALEQTGKHVFLETSKDLLRFQRLRHLKDWNVKVIRMVRDVRWFAYTKRTRLDPIAAATQWRSYHEAADALLRGLPQDDYTLLRYEDLCSRPAETARSLQRFLGLPEVDPPITFFPERHHILGDGIDGPFTISTVEHWRDGLDSKVQADAVRIAGSLHERFGYG